MKYYIICFWIVLWLPSFSQANDPCKKCNTIEVALNENVESAYKKVGQTLSLNGYGIASSDALLMSITTDFKTLGILNTVKHRFFIFVLENGENAKVVIRGEYDLNQAASAWSYTKQESYLPIDYRGVKSSPVKKAWELMDGLAKQIGTEVLYSLR